MDAVTFRNTFRYFFKFSFKFQIEDDDVDDIAGKNIFRRYCYLIPNSYQPHIQSTF